jgi:hypothetical protein
VAVSHLAADAGPIVQADVMVHDDRDVIETGGHLRVRLPLALDYPVTPSPGRLAVGRDTLSGSAGRAGQGVIGHGSPDGEAIVLRNAGFHGPECVKMLERGLQEVKGHYLSAAIALNRDLILV